MKLDKWMLASLFAKNFLQALFTLRSEGIEIAKEII